MKLTTTRETLYGGPLARGKRYHYVTKLNGHQIACDPDKAIAERKALNDLIGAWNCTTSTIYASVAADGSVFTTREYLPGCVESAHHRQTDGRGSGICLSRCEIDGKGVTVAEYHAHYLALFNLAVA